MSTQADITITANTGQEAVVDVDTANSDGGGERAICTLCLKLPVKYTCPRCNIPYCSLDCYKSEKHQDCSEMFYKDCFMEGLKDRDVDPADKHKMMEMLSRVENDADLGHHDDELDNDLDERLNDLDLDKDTEEVWNRLTEKEKKEFSAMVGDGRLGNLVQIWTPWWEESGSPLVTEMDSQSDSSILPKLKTDIPNISDLCKLKPSADVKYNVVNLLYAYVFICRLHNGDHVSMATEAAGDIVDLSSVLGQGQNFQSVTEAIEACLGRLQSKNSNFESTHDFNISVLMDIKKVIYGSLSENPLQMILLALSDVNEIFKRAHKITSKQHKVVKSTQRKEKLSTNKKLLFKSLKKCEFLLSWAQSYGMALTGLVPDIDMEYAKLFTDLVTVNQSKKQLEAQWGGCVRPKKKKLIEEI